MTYDRQKLVELIREHALSLGEFTLSSGQTSNYYIDARLVTLSSRGSILVAAGILSILDDDPVDAIGGLTLGADPVVSAALTLAGIRGLSLRGFLVRKQAKEHGQRQAIEGPIQAGDRVAVVEDVTTTGGSAQKAIDAVSELGARVIRVITVLDRLAGARESFESQGIKFSALLTIRDLGL